jgi:hypothetical protein
MQREVDFSNADLSPIASSNEGGLAGSVVSNENEEKEDPDSGSDSRQ